MKPPIRIEAPGYFLFIEGGKTIEEVMTVVRGDPRFACLDVDPGYCRFEGEGEILVHGHRCMLDDRHLSCDDAPLDLSLGGILITDDGRIQPVNPLPMLAR